MFWYAGPTAGPRGSIQGWAIELNWASEKLPPEFVDMEPVRT